MYFFRKVWYTQSIYKSAFPYKSCLKQGWTQATLIVSYAPHNSKCDFGDIDLTFKVTSFPMSLSLKKTVYSASSEPVGFSPPNLHRYVVWRQKTEKLYFDDLDLIYKVTTALCNFKVWPNICLCMLSLEIIDGFQPVSLWHNKEQKACLPTQFAVGWHSYFWKHCFNS